MPKRRVQKIAAWSFSRLSTYENCPFSAKLKFIDKLKEPSSPALERGSDIHKKAEKYAIGTLRKMPKELELFSEEFKDLRKRKKSLEVEQQLAVNVSWDPCDWFGFDAWCRAVIDLKYIEGDALRIVDYKTGKVRPGTEQLDLYAAINFAYAPGYIKTIDTSLWFLDWGEVISKNYTRAEAKKLIPKWNKRVKKMLADTTFKPTPGNLCRWCFFGQAGKKKGGPGICKF